MESTQPVQYGENGARIYSVQEIESHQGKYDKDGFYILKDGDFFDPYGYYFDENGLDEVGGFYSDETNEYVKPSEYENQDYEDYYEELCGSESDEDDEENPEKEKDYNEVDEYNIPEDEANRGIRLEHCIPAIKWLTEENPADKKHIIKVLNIPRKATE